MRSRSAARRASPWGWRISSPDAWRSTRGDAIPTPPSSPRTCADNWPTSRFAACTTAVCSSAGGSGIVAIRTRWAVQPPPRSSARPWPSRRAWSSPATPRQRLRGAESLLAKGRQQMDRRDYGAAVHALGQGLTLIDRSWAPLFDRQFSRTPDLHRRLARQLARARRDLLAEEIHELADRLRWLYGTETAETAVPRDHGTAPADDLGSTRSNRGTTGRRARPEARGAAPNRLPGPGDPLGGPSRAAGPAARRTKARREALRTLDEAERSLGPSPVLECERQAHAKALGLADLARGGPPPRRAGARGPRGSTMPSDAP